MAGATHVILVEPDRDLTELLASMLKGSGYPVLQARDARAVEACLASPEVGGDAIVIVDVSVADLTSIIELARGAAGAPRAVLMGAAGAAGDEDTGLPFLLKPFSREQLLACLAKLASEAAR